LTGLFLPQIAFAKEYTITVGGNPSTVTYEGLVPCGRELEVNGFLAIVPCQLCHLFILIKGAIDFVLIYLVFPVAILFLAIGGMMFFFYAESPEKVETGKKIITSVIIGLVITLGSWLLLGMFFTAIGLTSLSLQFTGPDQWFTVECPISYETLEMIPGP